MEIKTGYLTKTELAQAKSDHEKTHFKSSLNCFRDHNGFRPGEIHAFVAPKGGGKSTLSRTILADLLYSEKRTLLYLSEEQRSAYMRELNTNFRQIYGNDEARIEEILSRLVVVSELDSKIETAEAWLKNIKFIIEEECIDLFVFDNFTTSFLGELFVSQQSKILRDLKKLVTKQEIPVLIFLHTSKGKGAGLFSGDDVRGSATAVNLGSYNYILFYFRHIQEAYLWIEKARYHRKANGQIYKLDFDSRAGIFMDSSVTNLTELKNAAQRNT